jgi:hypothetical protein
MIVLFPFLIKMSRKTRFQKIKYESNNQWFCMNIKRKMSLFQTHNLLFFLECDRSDVHKRVFTQDYSDQIQTGFFVPVSCSEWCPAGLFAGGLCWAMRSLNAAHPLWSCFSYQSTDLNKIIWVQFLRYTVLWWPV